MVEAITVIQAATPLSMSMAAAFIRCLAVRVRLTSRAVPSSISTARTPLPILSSTKFMVETIFQVT